MTDPIAILATAMLATAIALPVGVAAGRRQERERWERGVEKLARKIRDGEYSGGRG